MTTTVHAKAVITDASSPISQALCRALRRRGVNILIIHPPDTPPPSFEAPVAPTCIVVEADIADRAGRLKVAQAAWQMEGSLNFLLHAHTEIVPALFQEADPKDLWASLQANLVAPLALTQALLPQLVHDDHASVIAIDSPLGRRARARHYACCASTYALRGAFEALAREYLLENLRFMTLTAPAPGDTMPPATSFPPQPVSSAKALESIAESLLSRATTTRCRAIRWN